MKKILSLIIALAMMVTSIGVFAADEVELISEPAYTYDEKAFDDAQNLMNSLLGTNVFGTDAVATVTRAQFVAGMCSVFKVYPLNGVAAYDDVPVDNSYAGFIAAAKAMGWISEATNFEPDRDITLAEAVKITLVAAEYKAMADAKGGYPAGYLTVARSIDLLDDIDTVNAEKVTVADASILFYNIMFAPVFQITGYGDEMSYERGGKTYIELIYDATLMEGVVTSTSYSSLVYGAELNMKNDTVEIDGIEYKYANPDFNLLGKKVTAYVDNNSKTVGSKTIFCIIEAENNEFEVLAKDFIGINGTQFSYDENGKERKERLDSAYKVIYNGRRVEGGITEEMLNDEYAVIRLVDNNSNNVYDVIFVDGYKYLKVANIDYISGYVSFVDNADKFINLNDPDADRICTIYNELGEEVELFEVTNNIIVGVKSSADWLIHEIAMCPSKPIEGIVTTYDAENNTISLGDITYAMSKDFVAKNIDTGIVKVGDTIGAFVGLNGELVYLDKTQSEFIYGMVTNTKTSTGVDATLMVEMFTQDGFVTLEFAEKVSYDSAPKTTNHTLIENMINDKYDDGKTILKYSLDSQGRIDHIDFPVDESANSSYNPASNQPSYDSFTKAFAGKSGNYRPGVSGLVSTVVLSDATMIVDLDKGGAKKFEKEDRYFYTSAGTLENNYSYTMDLYDVDENGYAGFAFVTGGPTDSSKSTSLRTYIIEKCSRGVTDEYEGYNITCYGQNTYGTYFLPDESLMAVGGEKRQPKPGDLIRFTIEKDNVIDEYYADFYCEMDLGDENTPIYKKILGNGATGPFFNNAKGVPSDVDTSSVVFANGGYSDSQMRDLTGSSAAGYVTGYVYNSERTMVVCNGNDSGEYSFADFRPYLLPSTVVLFDTSARKVTVTPYMPSAVKTYKANPGSEDFVVLRNNAGKPEVAFIYR